MELKNLTTHYKIKAEVEDVYAAITNPFTIELWTGCKAKMSTEPGSEFEIFEGDIVGKNIEFIHNEKVVQEWYFGDQPAASIVTITIRKDKGNVNIKLEHTNIPAEDYDDIAEGWDEAYWGAIKELLETV